MTRTDSCVAVPCGTSTSPVVRTITLRREGFAGPSRATGSGSLKNTNDGVEIFENLGVGSPSRVASFSASGTEGIAFQKWNFARLSRESTPTLQVRMPRFQY